MNIPNHERVLVNLLREIADEQGIKLTSFSHDWILRLEKDGMARHVMGYNFEINSAASHMLAGDKAATYSLLAHLGVPAVEHKLFLKPTLADYVSSKGNWDAIQAYAKHHDHQLVAKPNEGTGGNSVLRINTPLELEQAAHRLFSNYRAFSLSPFLEIEQEYRVIVLDDECELLYAKLRPTLTGDGRSTALELIEQQLRNGSLSDELASQALESLAGGAWRVLDAGQELLIGWKHNLGAGALPLQLEAGELHDQLADLAQRARQAINIRFASIDIVQVDGKLLVLEINSGIMIEQFVRHFPEQRQAAKAIYAKAIQKMFAGA